MKKVKIISVVGARPNFMKIAPILREFSKCKFINSILLHTGQHYDKNMSQTFFNELDIKKPEINLEVGSYSHAVQTAKIMEKSEEVFLREKPDLVLVVGDVNSTVACTLVAKKLGIKVGHIEAGLRSFDMDMPEEINRKVTDSISDLLFTTSIDANYNLIKEGVDKKNIFLVGNCMIDTLVYELKNIGQTKNEKSKPYAILTLHRPSNVDSTKKLKELFTLFKKISNDIPIYFPVHPRTMAQIEKHKLRRYLGERIYLLDPLPYRGFLELYKESTLVMTDSGGIQEETTFLNIPCITLRENTERPVTITEGTNHLVGTNHERILKAVRQCLKGMPSRKRIKYWDGKASLRISKIILKAFSG